MLLLLKSSTTGHESSAFLTAMTHNSRRPANKAGSCNCYLCNIDAKKTGKSNNNLTAIKIMFCLTWTAQNGHFNFCFLFAFRSCMGNSSSSYKQLGFFDFHETGAFQLETSRHKTKRTTTKPSTLLAVARCYWPYCVSTDRRKPYEL